MQVRDAMTKDPVCATPETPIVEIARLMVQHDCGAIPIVRDLASKIPLGLVTDRDIMVRTIAAGRDASQMSARDCMTSPAITVLEGARLSDCVELLELGQIRRAIVVDVRGGCSGIVAQADIARHASKRATGDMVREVSRRSVPAFAAAD